MKIRLPDEISVFTSEDRNITLSDTENPTADDVALKFNLDGDRLSVGISARTSPLFYLSLRWSLTEDERRENVRVMGDAWERSYGELRWGEPDPDRYLPWYMLVSNGSDADCSHTGRITEGFGVEVRPCALCSWMYDGDKVTLFADLRCGGDGVLLGGRRLEVCRVLMSTYRDVSAFEAGKAFCSEMCHDPLTTDRTVFGSNNWYYAVGNSSHGQILRDAYLISRLTEGISPRPYMVIDDGWQRHSCDGPWKCGNDSFPDMKRLAAEITSKGAVPGIWVRFLSDSGHESGLPEECYLSSRPAALDPSHPLVIEYVKDTVRHLIGWGYKLIKHDFTFFDLFNTYGNACGSTVTGCGWSFRDRSRTSAEIVLGLYRAILDACDGDTVIIGCNTLSHLSAGLVHLMRTGYDTSGRDYDRTRSCGVNTLAFRMIQHGTFYQIDADCCSHTGRIDWRLNSEWLRLLGDSGTPLFVSVNPDCITEDQIRDMRRAFAKNAVQTDRMIPLDWMEKQIPEVYLVNGEKKCYRWYQDD